MCIQFFLRGRGASFTFGNLAHLGVVLFLSFALISIVSAQDYELEYDEFGMDGAVCYTTHYEIADLVKAQGVSNETQESISGDYVVETTTGLKDEPVTRVHDWLYF